MAKRIEPTNDPKMLELAKSSKRMMQRIQETPTDAERKKQKQDKSKGK